MLAKEAGLATLPGTAAEILDDEVRAVICPDKIDTEEWLDAHRTAHSVGLRSNVTIMFGHVERPEHVARHLVRTRDAAEGDRRVHRVRAVAVRAHGHADLPAAEGPARARRCARCCSCTRSGASRTAGWIDNVQVSWVKTGVAGARQALQAGCNDLGGTLMDENISRAAGASHGQELDESELPRHRRAARPPARAAHHALRPHPHRGPPAAPAARGGRGRPRRRGAAASAVGAGARRGGRSRERAGAPTVSDERCVSDVSTSSASATRWSTS